MSCIHDTSYQIYRNGYAVVYRVGDLVHYPDAGNTASRRVFKIEHISQDGWAWCLPRVPLNDPGVIVRLKDELLRHEPVKWEVDQTYYRKDISYSVANLYTVTAVDTEGNALVKSDNYVVGLRAQDRPDYREKDE